MLKGIPAILPPELFKVLMEMGHGDELLIADGNYPRFGQPDRVIRCDGHGIPEILDAILIFMPLDSYVEHPVTLMEVLPNDPYIPEIWDKYREIGFRHEENGLREKAINKFDFYEQGAKTYAVVTTSESALYANLILKKGVVKV
jgi:L-fucose mutarotase